jgi:hypothetical protein
VSLEVPSGAEALRVSRADEVPQLTAWVHDAWLEDAIQFSAETRRAVIPFLQESAWGDLHPSMADPTLVKKTLISRHYRVPLTRCYIVANHATSLEADIEWDCSDIVEAQYSESTFRLMSDYSGSAAVAVRVTELDIRLLVSAQRGGWVYRKVMLGWPVESDTVFLERG